jgi:hypothetical protein
MTTLSARPSTPARVLATPGPRELAAPRVLARLAAHLVLGALPVLGISADVFGWIGLHALAVYVLLPLALGVALLVVLDRDRLDVLILAAFCWGMLACAAYDAFRLPTIYVAHWWGDFFGSVGGWATGGRPNYAVGYLWRYAGDGGGIAVPFFVLMACLPPAIMASRRRAVLFGVAYAVCPVWTGLVLTDVLAPAGRELFPLTPATLVLSLGGHLVYGSVLGFGCWHSRRLQRYCPVRFARAAAVPEEDTRSSR